MPDAVALRIAASFALPPFSRTALESSDFGPFELREFIGAAARPDAAALQEFDALLVGEDDVATAVEAGADVAIVVVLRGSMVSAAVLDWLQRGAQDVLTADELLAPTLPLRVRAAIERQRRAREARTAYATDLGTGLPHQQQLVEHMSQLLALREREPAPMALLALRIEGFATTEARLGREAANVLRRKLGVRLRAGVRASDVVAALGDDRFAVLLGSMLAPADAPRVGAKLLKSLMEPFRVAGHDVTVASAIGIGQYPQDGTQPDALLRRAVGLAAAAPAQGRTGLSNFDEAGGRSGAAANDD